MQTLGISDHDAHAAHHHPHANGHHGRRFELLRWLVELSLAGLIAYFTAIGTLREEIATVKATEQSHFEEVLRSLTELKVDVRELRAGRKP